MARVGVLAFPRILGLASLFLPPGPPIPLSIDLCHYCLGLRASPANHFWPNSNSFFLIPVFHFPWSEKGCENRQAAKTERQTV